MLTFPVAKINIGLFITARRPDGYHTLETLFYPVEWCDALEIVPSGQAVGEVDFQCGGLVVDCAPEQNLIVKAYRRLAERYASLMQGVRIRLEKQIPFGAGLGGGSSDGAHALCMLRALFHLPASDAEIEAMAAAMGADCAFFCRAGDAAQGGTAEGTPCPQLCVGIGHELTPSPLSLRGYHLVVVKPPFGISTREAYADVTPEPRAISLAERLTQPVSQWQAAGVVNDFERSLFPKYPALQSAKETLLTHGALYAAMSGSGSALFGIFDHCPQEADQWFAPDFQCRTIEAKL